MKRKQSQEFVLRMPLKMGCLKIAKVELWQKNKKIKNSKQTQKRLCVKSDCVTVELLSVRYQNPSTLKKCILLIVISIRCSIFTVQNLTKEAVSAFVSWGVGGCIPVLSSILGLKPYLCDFCDITFSLKVR